MEHGERIGCGHCNTGHTNCPLKWLAKKQVQLDGWSPKAQFKTHYYHRKLQTLFLSLTIYRTEFLCNASNTKMASLFSTLTLQVDDTFCMTRKVWHRNQTQIKILKVESIDLHCLWFFISFKIILLHLKFSKKTNYYYQHKTLNPRETTHWSWNQDPGPQQTVWSHSLRAQQSCCCWTGQTGTWSPSGPWASCPRSGLQMQPLFASQVWPGLSRMGWHWVLALRSWMYLTKVSV